MKKFSKILSVALLVALVLSLGVANAFAADTGTITITPPTGLAADATNVYKVYKVFDAVGDGTGENGAMSYTLCTGDTLSQGMIDAGFAVDDQGNVSGPASLNAAAIAAIAAYVTEADKVAEVTATGSNPVTTAALPNGYYYIATSTGSVVTIDSTNPAAEVIDKNTVPGLDKEITKANSITEDATTAAELTEEGKAALAQIGTEVEYTAKITVGKGMKNYEFHDTMSSGLTLVDGSVSVSYSATPENYGGETINTGAAAAPETIFIAFADGLAENTVITITYKAVINELALQTDPENNTAYVTYGDENSHNKTPDEVTKTWNAQISVLKKDGKNTEATTDDEALPGAGFILKNNTENDVNKGKYYHLATVNGKPVVQWVDKDQADEQVSDNDGKVAPFTGLCAGTYVLEEKTVPAGYNKAADVEVTITSTGETTYTDTNLKQEKLIVNNKGTQLPSTGGIGTTIFYVVGGVLVLAAIILLVTKKRMSE